MKNEEVTLCRGAVNLNCIVRYNRKFRDYTLIDWFVFLVIGHTESEVFFGGGVWKLIL